MSILPTDCSLVLKNADLFGTLHDVLVVDGTIAACKPTGTLEVSSDQKNLPVYDAERALLFPSFVDAHTHMRDPGYEYKEDLQTGLCAAAFGGFSGVMAMANTRPVNDNASVTKNMLQRAAMFWPNGPRLYPIGALTVGLEGKEMAPIGELAGAGCVAVSNDGKPVGNTELFRRSVEYAADFGMTVIDHCEDPDLARGYHMNEGVVSGHIGMKGQPFVGEAMQVARDILLAEYLGISIHLAHISCRQSVDLIAWGKARGVKITAETCPHYLYLDETALATYDPAFKVSPPLRTSDDCAALIEAVANGTIDILATDHAPHAAHEKEKTLDDAPCGFIGLETAVSLTYRLVRDGKMNAKTLATRWSDTPAQIFNLEKRNTFAEGDPADFFLFDPKANWTVCRETLHSKSLNTPFFGQTLAGRVLCHWIGGHLVAEVK